MNTLTDLVAKFLPTFFLIVWLETINLIIMMLILLLIDMFSAIYRSWKFRKEKKKWFNYKKLKTTIEKFICYSLAVIVAWIIEDIYQSNYGLINYVAGFISVHEAYSIFRHFAIITNGNVFLKLIDKINKK